MASIATICAKADEAWRSAVSRVRAENDASLVLSHVAERAGIEARLLLQTEHALADDVALNLVGATRDGDRGHRDQNLLAGSLARGVAPSEHRFGAGHDRMHAGARARDVARSEFSERALGSLRPSLLLDGARATR